MMDSGIKYKREASYTTEVNNKNMMKLSIKKEFVRSGTDSSIVQCTYLNRVY